MYTQVGNAISTRGIICGSAGSITTSGHLCLIVIEEIGVEIPTGGKPLFRPELPRWIPSKGLPKLISITAYAYGQVVVDHVLVDPDVELTFEDIEVSDGENGITIEVIGIQTYKM